MGFQLLCALHIHPAESIDLTSADVGRFGSEVGLKFLLGLSGYFLIYPGLDILGSLPSAVLFNGPNRRC